MSKKGHKLDWKGLTPGRIVVAVGDTLPSCLVPGQEYRVEVDGGGWPFVTCGDGRIHFLNDEQEAVFTLPENAPAPVDVHKEVTEAAGISAEACTTPFGDAMVHIEVVLDRDGVLPPVVMHLEAHAARLFAADILDATLKVEAAISKETKH